MQGTQIQSLVGKIPYAVETARPVSHNFHRPTFPGPGVAATEACVPRARALEQAETTALRSLHTTTKSQPPACYQLKKAHAAKNKSFKKQLHIKKN